MTAFSIFLPALILAIVSTLCLLAKNEGLRGMGRVAGGFSWILFGLFITVLTNQTHQLPSEYTVPGIVLSVLGLVTVVSGARKFFRRNISN